jgi:hypothetical protein
MFLFGVGTLFATATHAADGSALATATPVQFGTLQEVSGEISFEEKKLYGSRQFPVAVGRGKGKMDFKAKTANLTGQILADLVFGVPITNGIKDVTSFATAIPAASPYTVTIAPPSSGTFVSDQGVIDVAAGSPMKRVSSAPATGQYSVSAAGVYTFAAADTGKSIAVSYEYSATDASAQVIQITNQQMGYAPMFKAALDLSYQGKSMTLVLNRCSSSKLSLPFKADDFVVPDFDFSAMEDDAGNIGYIALKG